MYSVRIRLFGNPEIVVSNQVTPKPRSKKTAALLAWLALNANQDYARERIAQLFWADSSSESSLASLRMSVSNLRKVFGAGSTPLVVTRNTLALHTTKGNCVVDAHELIHAHKKSSRIRALQDHHLKAKEIEKLEEISALYADQFLAGYKFSDAPELDNWITTKQSEFEHIANDLTINLGNLYLEKHDYENAIRSARRAITVSAFFEPAHLLLLEAFARDGQRSKALAHYKELRHQMYSHIELTPSQKMQELVHGIRTSKHIKQVQTTSETVSRPRKTDVTVSAISNARAIELKQVDEALRAGKPKIIKLLGEDGGGKVAILEHLAEKFRKQQKIKQVLELTYSSKTTDLVAVLAHQIEDRPENTQLSIFWLAEYLAETPCIIIANATREELTFAQSELLERLVMLTENTKVIVALREDNTFSIPTTDITFLKAGKSALNNRHIVNSCVALFREIHSKKVGRNKTHQIPQAEIIELVNIVGNTHAAIAILASRDWGLGWPELCRQLSRSVAVHTDFVEATIHWAWQQLTHKETHTLSYLVQFKGAIDIRAALTIAGVYATDIDQLIESGLIFRINQTEVRLSETVKRAVDSILDTVPGYTKFKRQFEENFYQYFLNNLVKKRNEAANERAYFNNPVIKRNWNNYLYALTLAVKYENWSILFHAFDVFCEMHRNNGLYVQAITRLIDSKTLLAAAIRDSAPWDSVTQQHLQAKIELALAQFHFLIEDYDSALEASQRAVGAATKLNIVELRAASSLQHICNQLLTENYAYVDAHLGNLQQLANKTENIELQVKSLYLTSILAILNGSTQMARRLLTQALSLCQSSNIRRKDELIVELLDKLRNGITAPHTIVRPHQLAKFVF